MEAVVLRVRKGQARGKARVKRRMIEEQKNQDQDRGRGGEGEGEGEGGDARGGKRTRMDELDQLWAELDKDVEGPSNNAQSGVEAVINTTPKNFEWEQWIQWLDENPSL
ncbi:hypothetical protein GJ744_002842 [Endocarpon pusillum]|uniref:Uncharacterized protein n=1 Tax=Endocarpon pusillum TaxID=364733 RepID=A0A8H7AAD0_9EURO|nr:hypothetical protein GJ744_002842 [Endocarpon pusillum]